MHIRSYPDFLRANNIGAPYGELEGIILLVSKNSYICFFSSSSSTGSSGYNFFFGGGFVESINFISC